MQNQTCFLKDLKVRLALIQIDNEIKKKHNAKNDIENKVSSAVNNFGNATCMLYFMQTVFVPDSKPKKEYNKNTYSIRNKLF